MNRKDIPKMVRIENLKQKLEQGQIVANPNKPVKILGGGYNVYANVSFPVEEITTLGRSSEHAQIVFPESCTDISRRHCQIAPTRTGIRITDLGSANGTFKEDGSRLTPYKDYQLQRGQSFYLAIPAYTFYIK